MVEELKLELEALKSEVAELRDMVAKLTAPPAPQPAVVAKAAAPAAAPKKAEAITEETLFLISAAVAAFLGKRARIKFVRPIQQSVDGWRLQGRVAIQGSHRVR